MVSRVRRRAETLSATNARRRIPRERRVLDYRELLTAPVNAQFVAVEARSHEDTGPGRDGGEEADYRTVVR